ncbi:MAG: T9SS type A sorting domain-containing protein [Bacteroidales bacterium]|nr:T9SS type A sorting domain-containing protein [Bacteroidales bacterium]
MAAAALCLCALPAEATGELKLSPPIRGIGSLYANGDGNLISYQWVADGWSISIFSPRLTLDKQFKICPYGDPTNEQLTTLVINREGKHYTSYLASQNVVNSDDKWEYVTHTRDTETAVVTYHVYNEDGVELGIIPSTTLMTVGDKNYIYETAKKDDGTTEYTLYAIEKANDSALSIRKVNGVNVFPNPVAPGETIRFEMPDGSIAGMEIYDGAGVQKLRRTDVDSEAATVPANKLSRGVNAYRITDENGQTFTCKIIVK